MANYKISISSSAEKSLRKIPKADLIKVVNAINTLSVNPYPDGCRKLSGETKTFRVRQGNYRIIYEIIDKQLIILVLKIGDRKDVYR